MTRKIIALIGLCFAGAALAACSFSAAEAAPMIAAAAHSAAAPEVLAATLAVAGLGATASPSLQATEAYSASKATHPRVSLADMEGKIQRQHFFTAGDAIAALGQPTDPACPTGLLTICILVMENGFTVIGKAAPVSPENFDAEKGRTFAYEDAIKQLWPLEGYALRERLSAEAA
ncbi:Gp49 family protein [Brevundimonas sp.]|uniref:Gp49 family protein n=1 Tax=Brevundimonas sp. TaxID=1871086 RepID=UPI0028AD1103|nr:Gp49 family protein [Brevundimonas sp.]